jgi:hypothetical protein
MKPFPSNLSPEDRRTYRRFVGGMLLSYLVALTVAIGITLTNRPASDLRTSNETHVARLKGTTGSTEVSPPARLTTSRP